MTVDLGIPQAKPRPIAPRRKSRQIMVGSVPVGGVIEVVEFDEARDLAWIGITGITQRGRFRLRDCPDGRTRVIFRMTYEAPGGILGVIADWVAARQVGGTMTRTLENLRSLTEA